VENRSGEEAPLEPSPPLLHMTADCRDKVQILQAIDALLYHRRGKTTNEQQSGSINKNKMLNTPQYIFEKGERVPENRFFAQ